MVVSIRLVPGLLATVRTIWSTIELTGRGFFDPFATLESQPAVNLISSEKGNKVSFTDDMLPDLASVSACFFSFIRYIILSL